MTDAAPASTSAQRELPLPRGLMLAVLLLAFFVRVYHLDYQSFWSDEGISLLRASRPVGEMLRDMPVEHAPGYFVGLNAWLRLTGTSDFAVRYLLAVARRPGGRADLPVDAGAGRAQAVGGCAGGCNSAGDQRLPGSLCPGSAHV